MKKINICEQDITGESVKKLSNSELLSLYKKVDEKTKELSIHNYYAYCERDCDGIADLNDTKQFFEVLITMAHMAKCNFEDAFGSVKIWEIFIYNTLKKQGLALAPKKDSIKEPFPGGFVQQPKPGYYEDLVVYDISSSYPNQIISYNMSPETLVDSKTLCPELRELQKKFRKLDWRNDPKTYIDLEDIKKYKPYLEAYNVCINPAGEFFRTDVDGIFAVLIDSVFQKRKVLKGEAKDNMNNYKEIEQELTKRGLTYK